MDDQQSLHFKKFCEQSGVIYNQTNFTILWEYIKTRFPETGAEIIPSRTFSAYYLDIKNELSFIPPPPAPPTEEQLQAERHRRLEAHNNVGPLSAKDDPRKLETPDSSITDLTNFVKRAIGNIEKEASGGIIPLEKPKPFRRIPENISIEDLKSGGYSVEEIKDYLRRTPRTPAKKQ